jgi:hypothetical protein
MRTNLKDKFAIPALVQERAGWRFLQRQSAKQEGSRAEKELLPMISTPGLLPNEFNRLKAVPLLLRYFDLG